MFCKPLVRNSLLVLKQDSLTGLKCVASAGVNARRQNSVSQCSGKPKTIDDLGGPSFLTSLYWLFGKGYFQITHQMQVKTSFRSVVLSKKKKICRKTSEKHKAVCSL